MLRALYTQEEYNNNNSKLV
uniref:Uncharacterized protein n=1 Tax=Amphimedon queenslandica TaxID=400682 RepID=A0A1X7SLU7_AMPQE